MGPQLDHPKSFEEKIFPQDVSMSPAFVLYWVGRCIEKYGAGIFWKDRRFKKAREMYESAVYVLGIYSRGSHCYYLEPEYLRETPDVVAFEYISDTVGDKTTNIRLNYDIEVTEWHQNSDASLVDLIKRKLENIRYSSASQLLVAIQKEAQIIDLARVAEEVARISKISCGSIWVLMKHKELNYKYSVFQIFPSYHEIHFDLNEELKTNKENQPGMMHSFRGIAESRVVSKELELPELEV